MRFDDRLTTLLAAKPGDAGERAVRWAQLADVYAQGGPDGVPHLQAQIMQRLKAWHADVPFVRRRSVAAAIATQRLPADLVELFASDAPQVAAPMLLRVHLPGEHWQRLIHAMPPASRNLLRQRRDLPMDAEQTLLLYAQSDLALTYEETAEAIETAEEPPIQIRDLVARIEAYRRDHPLPKAGETEAPQPDHFRFETGPDGIIRWADGVERAALIGLDLTEAGDDPLAMHLKAGCDFEGGRFVVPGASNAAGVWEVSAKAITRPPGGFHAIARRAEEESAQPILAGALAPDSVRQLAHELRTPLNAIRGFAEMIAGQFLGPVAAAYRERALAVAGDAARLSAVIDDLDLAAKIDSNALADGGDSRCDAGQVLRRVASQLRSVAEARALIVQVSVPSTLPDAAIAEDDAARLFGRLLAALAAVAEQGSTIPITLSSANGRLELVAGRPAPLTDLDEAVLKRSVLGAEEKDGPPLGFGFALRLAQAHAAASGGRVTIHDGHFALSLPIAEAGQLDHAANS